MLELANVKILMPGGNSVREKDQQTEIFPEENIVLETTGHQVLNGEEEFQDLTLTTPETKEVQK